MTAALSQIFGAVDTRLTAAVADDDGSYDRMPSGDPDVFPALAVYDEGDEPSEQGHDRTGLDLQFTVEGYVEGSSGIDAHDKLIELHAAAVAALCGDVGSNLGGLVENIEIIGRRRVDTAELASKRRLGFAQDFQVTFATKRGDPATLL